MCVCLRDGNQALKSVCMLSLCSRGASQNIPLYDLQSKHVKYYNLKCSVISLSLFYHTHLLFNLILKYRDSNTETVLFSHIWERNFIQEHYTTLHQQHRLSLVNMRKMTIYAVSLWSASACVWVLWAKGRLCVFFFFQVPAVNVITP